MLFLSYIPFGCKSREGPLEQTKMDGVFDDDIAGAPKVEGNDMVYKDFPNLSFKFGNV